VLNRPDGHIAAVVGTADLTRIEHYLDTVGIRSASSTSVVDVDALAGDGVA
jgi:hypothetical protein